MTARARTPAKPRRGVAVLAAAAAALLVAAAALPTPALAQRGGGPRGGGGGMPARPAAPQQRPAAPQQRPPMQQQRPPMQQQQRPPMQQAPQQRPAMQQPPQQMQQQRPQQLPAQQPQQRPQMPAMQQPAQLPAGMQPPKLPTQLPAGGAGGPQLPFTPPGGAAGAYQRPGQLPAQLPANPLLPGQPNNPIGGNRPVTPPPAPAPAPPAPVPGPPVNNNVFIDADGRQRYWNGNAWVYGAAYAAGAANAYPYGGYGAYPYAATTTAYPTGYYPSDAGYAPVAAPAAASADASLAAAPCAGVLPGAPATLSAGLAQGGGVALQWAPPSNGGCVTYYEVAVQDVTGGVQQPVAAYGSPQTFYQVPASSLAPGRSYAFVVRSVSSTYGGGGAAQTSLVYAPAGVGRKMLAV